MTQNQYLTLDQLRQKLGGIGRSTVYRYVDDKKLPPPLKLGKRLFWRESEIDALMKSLSENA